MMAGKIAAASIDEKMEDALLNETLNEIGDKAHGKVDSKDAR